MQKNILDNSAIRAALHLDEKAAPSILSRLALVARKIRGHETLWEPVLEFYNAVQLLVYIFDAPVR